MRVVKILHVEDVPEDYEQIDRVLKKSGLAYESICVSTKPAYTAALDDFKPDVILCDHALPSFNSIDAARILSDKEVKVPIILVTGSLSESFISDVLKAGIVDYVLKDRPLRLPSAIKSALEKNDLERKKDLYFKTIIQQEKRFRALIENISEAIVVIDKAGQILYHSPSATSLTGLENSEVLNQNIFSFIHPDDLDSALDSLARCTATPRCTIEGVFRIRHKSGDFFWAEGSITNLLDEVTVNGYIVNYRDVTERRNQQRLLAESEANLRVLFDNTDTSYIFLTRDFRVVSFNKPSVEMFLDIGNVVIEKGESLLHLLPAFRTNDVKEKLNRVLHHERVAYEVVYDLPAGQTWLSILLLPVIGKENGEFLGIIVSVNDITVRKRIELEREKMTTDLIIHVKNLQQFAYIVSHNLRSPVANIIGLSAMLQEMSGLTEADKKRCLQGLSLSAEKLDQIIKDLNYILQVRRDISETREKVKVSSVLKDIVRSFQKIIESENISIVSDFRQCDEIFTVRSYLHSIIYNLVSNSIKYRHSLRPCTINIKSEISGNNVILTFRDNGLGIDLKTNGDKIFGLYKRFHTHIEGKGLGLYMVKTQIEILGGSISVSSVVDEGSVFTVILPRQE